MKPLKWSLSAQDLIHLLKYQCLEQMNIILFASTCGRARTTEELLPIDTEIHNSIKSSI
jgi:hypothetical protein